MADHEKNCDCDCHKVCMLCKGTGYVTETVAISSATSANGYGVVNTNKPCPAGCRSFLMNGAIR